MVSVSDSSTPSSNSISLSSRSLLRSLNLLMILEITVRSFKIVLPDSGSSQKFFSEIFFSISFSRFSFEGRSKIVLDLF